MTDIAHILSSIGVVAVSLWFGWGVWILREVDREMRPDLYEPDLPKPAPLPTARLLTARPHANATHT